MTGRTGREREEAEGEERPLNWKIAAQLLSKFKIRN